MNKNLIQKNIRLSTAFDKFVASNPKILDKVPHSSNIIITCTSDKKLSELNMAFASNSRSGRFVVANKSSNGWRIKTI